MAYSMVSIYVVDEVHFCQRILFEGGNDPVNKNEVFQLGV